MSIETANQLLNDIGLTPEAKKVVAIMSGAMAAMEPPEALSFYLQVMSDFDKSLAEVEIPNAPPGTAEYVRRAFLAYVEARVLGPLLPTGGRA